MTLERMALESTTRTLHSVGRRWTRWTDYINILVGSRIQTTQNRAGWISLQERPLSSVERPSAQQT